MFACFRDRYFYFLLLLGPLTWLAISLYVDKSTQLELSYRSLLLLLVVYPVLEEIVFRGLLLDMLKSLPMMEKRYSVLTMANVVCSVLFAVSHLYAQPPLWAASVFFPALIFGISMERYQHLLAPITLHIFYNGGFFLLLYN